MVKVNIINVKFSAAKRTSVKDLFITYHYANDPFIWRYKRGKFSVPYIYFVWMVDCLYLRVCLSESNTRSIQCLKCSSTCREVKVTIQGKSSKTWRFSFFRNAFCYSCKKYGLYFGGYAYMQYVYPTTKARPFVTDIVIHSMCSTWNQARSVCIKSMRSVIGERVAQTLTRREKGTSSPVGETSTTSMGANVDIVYICKWTYEAQALQHQILIR